MATHSLRAVDHRYMKYEIEFSFLVEWAILVIAATYCYSVFTPTYNQCPVDGKIISEVEVTK